MGSDPPTGSGAQVPPPSPHLPPVKQGLQRFQCKDSQLRLDGNKEAKLIPRSLTIP